MTAYVYILQCADKTLYTGWTNDLKKRISAHRKGKGAKYTRARLPVELVYFEELPEKQAAQQREYKIKQLNRAAKIKLIAAFNETNGQAAIKEKLKE
jgi:putative endonuclease